MSIGAEQLKLAGMFMADAAASDSWKAAWDAAIIYLADLRVPFTSEEVRALAGPPTDHPNAAGARFLAAARKGRIRAIGYRKSHRESLHKHPLTLWVGTSKEI